jgi:hypothetical protein
MVRLLHLTTRCTSTMAAVEPLRRLLHDCRNTPTPFLLPPCPPKGPPCPWSAMTQTNTTSSSLTAYSYSQALQAPPPNCVPLGRQPHSAPTLIIPPVRPPFAKHARQRSWRWHSLAHHLTILLPPPICPTPPTSDIIFNNTLHWLPAHDLQTLPLPTTTDNSPNVPAFPHTNPSDNVASFRFNNDTYSYSAQDDDDRNIPALPAMSSVTPSTSCPPSTRIITFPCPSPINIDICKIYSPNVYGLWC